MKVLLDLNVLLDVLQMRQEHYENSAAVLSRAAAGELEGLIPSHAVTTIHYVIRKAKGAAAADDSVDWMLGRFRVAAAGKEVFTQARGLAMNDFEDAVVASMAEAEGCDYVVTRNTADFAGSRVKAITPQALEAMLAAKK